MQVRRVAAVAAGALATAAAMGSPAFAAMSAGSPEAAPEITGLLNLDGAQQANDDVMRGLADRWLAVTPEQTWPAPWDVDHPQILSVGSGTAVSALAWQSCGSSSVQGIGAVLPIASPNTVRGDCANGNVHVRGNGGDDALFSVLDNAALSLAPWQSCGSSSAQGVGVVAPIASPNTVDGDCSNGNISVDTRGDMDDRYDYVRPAQSGAQQGASSVSVEAQAVEEQAVAEQVGPPVPPSPRAPWEHDPPTIVSVASGAAASVAAWQACGSSSADAGVAAPIASPNTVLGDCTNGNIDVRGDQGNDALFSVLDGVAASIAPWQTCGSTKAGVGAAAAIASPNTVMGDCSNGNLSVSE